MREITHPFIKFGVALVMRENNLTAIDDITRDHLKRELEHSMNHFRVKPVSDIFNQKEVKYLYCDDAKGNPTKGIYLAPNILATDRSASKVIPAFNNILDLLKKNGDSNIEVTRAITPISAEFTRFGENAIGRGKSRISIEEASYCIIATTTEKKPSLAFKTIKKEKTDRENITIIPDLSINELIDFINFFERIRNESTENLLIGNVGEKENKPLRPKIFDGNFPHAPRSSNLGAIALLGAIGAWAKDAENIKWAKRVLDSLKGRPIYLIGADKTYEVFKYNHFVIDLAKENKLSTVVDSVYYTILYNQGKRNTGNRIEYQKYDLFTARFLQLFTIPAFKDFLAFRAAYPNQFETLLNKYFINMENIKPEVVKSARELGKWLNYAAYKVADRTIEPNAQDRNNRIRDQKAKSLIEIESSIFSARSGDALIFQAITRAGRSSGLDAPAEAELFLTEASTGAISLESAKHLLIAFSRVRNKYEPKDKVETENEDENDENESEALPDAQE